jgi:hypothetical protein
MTSNVIDITPHLDPATEAGEPRGHGLLRDLLDLRKVIKGGKLRMIRIASVTTRWAATAGRAVSALMRHPVFRRRWRGR